MVAEEGADHGAWGIGETERESERERERGGDRNIRVFFEKLGNVRVRGTGEANRTVLSMSLLGLIIFSDPWSYLSDVSLITATVISDVPSWERETITCH